MDQWKVSVEAALPTALVAWIHSSRTKDQARPVQPDRDEPHNHGWRLVDVCRNEWEPIRYSGCPSCQKAQVEESDEQ